MYTPDYRSASYRHQQAADALIDGHRYDVAGYLYGWAAECAVKHMMLESGMRPLPNAQRRNDPFYAHFESLKTTLRDTAHGRLQGRLSKIANDSGFMQRWDTSMRYSDGRAIQRRMVEAWRDNAKAAQADMDG